MANRDTGDFSPSVKREIVFREHWPSLYKWGVKEPADAASVKLLHRGADDWLALAKGYNHDGGAVVCFGSGSTLLEALAALEGGMASGRWRKDRPYKAK